MGVNRRVVTLSSQTIRPLSARVTAAGGCAVSIETEAAGGLPGSTITWPFSTRAGGTSACSFSLGQPVSAKWMTARQADAAIVDFVFISCSDLWNQRD